MNALFRNVLFGVFAQCTERLCSLGCRCGGDFASFLVSGRGDVSACTGLRCAGCVMLWVVLWHVAMSMASCLWLERTSSTH